MIGRYTTALLTLLAAIATASPHGAGARETVHVGPPNIAAAHEALDRLLARQGSCVRGKECGSGCMPTGSTCCGFSGSFVCYLAQDQCRKSLGTCAADMFDLSAKAMNTAHWADA